MELGFRIRPLDAAYAARLRADRRDAFGQPLQERHDAAPHQCRVCLELTKPHEPYLLLSHRAHPEGALYAETGPVFIHARECTPYAASDRYPPQFPRERVVLKAFSARHEIVGAAHAGKRPVEEVIRTLFEDPTVEYLHARNDTYGCYMFRIERAAA
jgi:hypothetical protein